MTTALALAGHPGPALGSWHHGGPFPVGFFPVFPLVPLLFWGLALWWLARAARRRAGGRRADGAAELALRDAYARGEVDEETYRYRLAVLRDTRDGRDARFSR